MNDFFIVEGITSVSALINNAKDQVCNSPRRVTDVYFDMSKIAKFDRSAYARYRFLKENSSSSGYIFHECTHEDISDLTSGNTHGGIAAKAISGEPDILYCSKICDNSVYFYLDGVDDPYNLGYIIRTLYAFGIAGIVLPENNKLKFFPSVVVKSSAGITEKMNIFVSSADDVCDIFKQKGYKIACTTLRDSSPCHSSDLSSPLLVVIGGEKRGISRKILNCADINIRIDYALDFNGSLPAVCAASVIGYEINRQRLLK